MSLAAWSLPLQTFSAENNAYTDKPVYPLLGSKGALWHKILYLKREILISVCPSYPLPILPLSLPPPPHPNPPSLCPSPPNPPSLPLFFAPPVSAEAESVGLWLYKAMIMSFACSLGDQPSWHVSHLIPTQLQGQQPFKVRTHWGPVCVCQPFITWTI